MQDVLEVTVEWCGTVIDVQHLGVDEHFTLDSETPYGGLDDLLPAEGLRLAQVSTEGIRVWIPQGVEGAYLGEDFAALPGDAAQSISLAPDTRARCTLGPLTIYFARVPAAVRPSRRTMFDLLGDVKTFGTAAALHALVMIVAIAMPPTRQALSIDRFIGDDRYVDVLMMPEDQLIPLLTPSKADVQKDGPEDGPDGAETPTEVVKAGPPNPSDVPRIAQTPEQIRDAAIAAAGEVTDALNDELYGAGDALGDDANRAFANLTGSNQGGGHGLDGGNDPFGGGGLFDGIGDGPKGNLAAAGVKTGCKGCRNVKTTYGRKQAKRVREPRVIPMRPTVADGLSRAEVMRTIRTKKNQYRTCYEAALQTRRGLQGKIRMAFIVGPNGQVISAKASENTMGVPDVANCIARRMRTWSFPRPRGGGIVKVTYPFLFRAPE